MEAGVDPIIVKKQQKAGHEEAREQLKSFTLVVCPHFEQL